MKTSTIFPKSWSDSDVINATVSVGNTPYIAFRSRDGSTLHQGTANGVNIEVVKKGKDVTSSYPSGGGFSNPSDF